MGFPLYFGASLEEIQFVKKSRVVFRIRGRQTPSPVLTCPERSRGSAVEGVCPMPIKFPLTFGGVAIF